jgi:hypothetical protein
VNRKEKVSVAEQRHHGCDDLLHTNCGPAASKGTTGKGDEKGKANTAAKAALKGVNSSLMVFI